MGFSLLNWVSYYYVARWMTGDATKAVTKWDECHSLRMDQMTSWAAEGTGQLTASPGTFGYPEDLEQDNLPSELVTGRLKDCLMELSPLTVKLAKKNRISPTSCNPNRMCLVYTKSGVRSILLPRDVYQAVISGKTPGKKGGKGEGTSSSSSSSSSSEAKGAKKKSRKKVKASKATPPVAPPPTDVPAPAA